MARKKKKLTAEHFMNYWLEKGHGVTVEWLQENEAELIKTSSWYKKYAVAQELHDQWYAWAIDELRKHYRWSKKMAEKNFVFDYLNLAPSVKEEAV